MYCLERVNTHCTSLGLSEICIITATRQREALSFIRCALLLFTAVVRASCSTHMTVHCPADCSPVQVRADQKPAVVIVNVEYCVRVCDGIELRVCVYEESHVRRELEQVRALPLAIFIHGRIERATIGSPAKGAVIPLCRFHCSFLQ